MGKSGEIGGKFCSARGKEAGERLVAFLRDRYPNKTSDCVAADTGLPATNVAKWLAGGSLPSFTALLALGLAYDIDFWAAVLPNPPECIVKERVNRKVAHLQAQLAELGR